MTSFAEVDMRNFYRKLRIKYKLFLLLAIKAAILIALGMAALQAAFYIYDRQLYYATAEALNLSSIKY